jgi:two-component system NtrC family sensor kinase
MVDGVTITDLHGRISYVNRAVTEQLGYRQEELVGKTPAILVTESDLPKIATQAQEVLLGKTLSKSTEYLARHRDGIGIPISMTFSVLRGSEGQPREIIAVSRDITERKRLEEQLRQSQKMEAIGRLAASLAHEINNPLQALSSGLRLLGRADLDERKRSQYLTITNREVNRLIGIVERVIGFYRPPTDMPSPTDIHVLLDETLVLAREKLLQSHITVQRDWAGDLPLVDAIADQLEQVFLNLILNAIGAMPDGGTLAVSTGRTKDDSAIGVRFADTGHGIAPEHFDHIFEPFYTTQPQGMGLGLAISYNIVKQHGGNIEVESQPGEGAAFTVTLPLG